MFRPGHNRRDSIAAYSVAEVAAMTLAVAAALSSTIPWSDATDIVTVTPYSNQAIQKTTKTLRLSGTDFFGANGMFDAGEFRALFGTSTTANARIGLPSDATIVGWRHRTYLGDVAGNVDVTLKKAIDGSVTPIDSDGRSGSSSGYATSATQVVSIPIDNSAFHYYATVLIDATLLANAQDARLGYVDIDYTSPSLDVSL